MDEVVRLFNPLVTSLTTNLRQSGILLLLKKPDLDRWQAACLSLAPKRNVELSVMSRSLTIINSNHQENELNNIFCVYCYGKNVSSLFFFFLSWKDSSNCPYPISKKNQRKTTVNPAEATLPIQ